MYDQKLFTSFLLFRMHLFYQIMSSLLCFNLWIYLKQTVLKKSQKGLLYDYSKLSKE